MKPRRVRILVLLAVAAIGFAGAVAFWAGSTREHAAPLSLGPVTTNSMFGHWAIVTLTNRSSKSFIVDFIVQIKEPTGWKDPPQLGGLEMRASWLSFPHSETTADMSLRALGGTPWRVVAGCSEEKPTGAAKYWFRFRRWLRHSPPPLVIVSPEMDTD